MFYEHEERGGVVVGRTVAVAGLLLALGELSRDHRYAVYSPRRDVDRVKAQFANAARISVGDRRLVAAAGPPAAWHDMELDTRRPFMVRDALRARYPITLTHHSLSYKELLHDHLLRLLLSHTRPYDAFVCTSRAARQALQTLVGTVAERLAHRLGPGLAARLDFPGRYEVIPLAVDCDRFRPNDRTRARARFDVAADAFMLLWVGRLSIIDKADLLPVIEALAELVRRHPERKLLLLCAGSERTSERFGAVLAAYARDLGVAGAVKIIPRHDDFAPWIAELYGAADVFISPVDNVQETFGLTPLEAMASGVPQVVSDWNGYRDIVVHQETGLLLPTRWTGACDDLSDGAWLADSPFDHLALAQSVAVDMRALVDAISQLIAQPELRSAMAEASRRRALAELSWQAIVPRYEALWRELAAEAARAGEPPPVAPAYDEPDYHRAFGHYASERIDDDAALTMTRAGLELCAGEKLLPLHYNASWHYLDVELLGRILGRFAKAHADGRPLSLGDIARMIDARARARTVRHVMWLLKYGYVRLA